MLRPSTWPVDSGWSRLYSAWWTAVLMSTKRFVGWGGRVQMYVHSGALWCGDPTSLPTSLQDTDSRCPIHVAISSRHPPCSAHLLVHPALNLTLKDRNGLTPFASALKHQDHHTGLAILTKGSEAAEQVGGARYRMAGKAHSTLLSPAVRQPWLQLPAQCHPGGGCGVSDVPPKCACRRQLQGPQPECAYSTAPRHQEGLRTACAAPGESTDTGRSRHGLSPYSRAASLLSCWLGPR